MVVRVSEGPAGVDACLAEEGAHVEQHGEHEHAEDA